MTIDTEYPNACREEFAELCALSTSGELSAEELSTLNRHVAGCPPCAALLREYSSLAHVGMAKLAANLTRDIEIAALSGYNEKKPEKRFFTAFRRSQFTPHSRLQSGVHLVTATDRWRSIKRPVLLVGTAAAVLLVCAGEAFELGRRMTPVPSPATFTAVVRGPSTPDEEKAKLTMDL